MSNYHLSCQPNLKMNIIDEETSIRRNFGREKKKKFVTKILVILTGYTWPTLMINVWVIIKLYILSFL